MCCIVPPFPKQNQPYCQRPGLKKLWGIGKRDAVLSVFKAKKSFINSKLSDHKQSLKDVVP
jgi:hypothetical protein